MRTAAVAAALVVAGAAPRILLAAGTLPSPLRAFVWSDILFTWERGMAGGRLPYWGSYFEYPPLDGYVSAVFALVASSPTLYVVLWTIAQAAAAAVVGWSLHGHGRAAWWGWALAPQLVLFGPMNFDLLAIAALVLGLRWERSHAPLRSAAALAVGTATKLFPAALLPLFLIRGPFDRRAAALRLSVFAGLLVIFYAPGAAAQFSTLESIGRYSVGIPANFDSLWGMVSAILTGIGMPAAPIIAVVTTAGLLATYARFALPAARATTDPATPAAIAVITLLVWSRLYSPQFSLWVLPFFAIAGLPLRAFVLLTMADFGVFVTVYPLTLVEGIGDDLRTVLVGGLAASVVLRHAALLVAWLAARRVAAPIR